MKKITFIAVMFLVSFLSSDIFAEKGPEYDKALQYYNSGNYKDAVTLFQNYVKKSPDASAYYRIGYGLYKLGKYEESEVYFKQAYLIDASFSPESALAPKKSPEKKIQRDKKRQAGTVALSEDALAPNVKIKEHESKPEVVSREAPSKNVPPLKDQKPAISPEKKPSLPDAQKVDPHKALKPPMNISSSKPPLRFTPGLITFLAGMGTFILIIEIILYLYFCSCLFFIAKKLDVPSPWIAWIPIAQVWTVVTSAGKPWWWILFLLVPILNVVIGTYLWMCVTENLGRNKWLGLLMLVPVINFAFVGILAYSKTENAKVTTESITPA